MRGSITDRKKKEQNHNAECSLKRNCNNRC